MRCKNQKLHDAIDAISGDFVASRRYDGCKRNLKPGYVAHRDNASTPGAAGENRLNGEALPPKFTGHARPGDRLLLASPGGGGYGLTENEQKKREIGKVT